MKKKILLIIMLTILAITILTLTNTALADATTVIFSNVVQQDEISKVEIVSNGENYKTDIKIVVTTGCEKIEVTPKTNYGYEPTIVATNFLDNGLSQIMYSANSGGSGAYMFVYVYSFENGTATTLFDYETLQTNFTAQYINNYRVEIDNDFDTFCVDISGTANLSDFYNTDGTVKPNTENPTVTAFNSAFVVQDGILVSKLAVLQKVYGGFTANNYTHVYTVLEFNNNGYKVVGNGHLSF